MSKSARNAAKTAELLEAGMEVLWTNGYNGTSVSDIVKAAGVPKGSFYFYFDSKDDFVSKALAAYQRKMIVPFITHLDDDSLSPGQRLAEFYRSKAEIVSTSSQSKKGCLACIVGSEVALTNEALIEQIADMHNEIRLRITKVALEAQANGELPPQMNVPVTIAFLQDAFKGVLLSIRESSSQSPMKNYQMMVEQMLFSRE